jgi:hypothetical protein
MKLKSYPNTETDLLSIEGYFQVVDYLENHCMVRDPMFYRIEEKLNEDYIESSYLIENRYDLE